MVDHDTWPPKQSSFTPLLLIHHQGDHTAEQVTTTAKLMHTGDKVALVTGNQYTIKSAKSGGHDKFQKVLKTPEKQPKKLEKF